MTPEERQNLSNEDIKLGKGGYDITCCSGEWLEDNVLSYKDVYTNFNNTTLHKFALFNCILAVSKLALCAV